jgi:N-acylneuraminate cytidylyltransferase
MPNVIALIPARSGSKGVAHKNMRDLAGHPLLEWSIAASKQSQLIDRTIVSTDSEVYAEFAVEKGAEAPFLRPPEISGDKSSDYDFIKHALDWLGHHGYTPDYIVHLRPTTPLRNPILIDQAIKHFMSHPEATALRSVHPMSESAYKSFEITPEGQLSRIGSGSTDLDAANQARQDFPTTYVANGYVDVLSTAFILSSQLIHGDYVLPFVTPVAHEVDTEEDFSYLAFQLSKYPEILSKLFS